MVEWQSVYRYGHEWRAYVDGKYTGYKVISTPGFKNIQFRVFKDDVWTGRYSYYLKHAKRKVETMIIEECEGK